MKLLLLSTVLLFALTGCTGRFAHGSGPNGSVAADDIVAYARPGTSLAALDAIFGPPHARSHDRGAAYYPPHAWLDKQEALGRLVHGADIDTLMYWNPKEGVRVALVFLDNDDKTVLEAETKNCSPWVLDPTRTERLIGKTQAEINRIVGRSYDGMPCEPANSHDTCSSLNLADSDPVSLHIEYGPDHRVRKADVWREVAL